MHLVIAYKYLHTNVSEPPDIRSSRQRSQRHGNGNAPNWTILTLKVMPREQHKLLEKHLQ